MITPIRRALFAIGLFVPSLHAPVTLAPTSKLWVEGGSTVRSWTCQAPAMTADLASTAADPLKGVLNLERTLSAVRLTVDVEKMDCGNGTMNEHMEKALKEKEHKTIAFKLSTYELQKDSSGVRGQLNGLLTIAGIEKQILMPVSIASAPDGAVRVKGAYQLDMREYGVTPPSLMMGTMKVKPMVTVKFELVLTP
jgi:polyisoprenoid-binding protein YceI